MSLKQIAFALFSYFIIAPFSFGQSTGLPKLIESSIDEETIAILRIDCSDPQILEVSKHITSSLDPIGTVGQRFGDLDRTIRSLAANQVKELYAITSTNDLPNWDMSILIPLNVTEEQHSKILGDLRKIQAKEFKVTPNGIIIPSSMSSLPNSSNSKTVRPEFSSGFSSVKESPFQLVISLGSSSKRVLRDALPTLLSGIDTTSSTTLAEGWSWAAAGLQWGKKRQLKLIVQTKDDAAGNLKKVFDLSIKYLSGLANQLSQSRRIGDAIASLKFTNDSGRVNLLLSDEDGSLKALLDEIAAPLATKGVKNSLDVRTKQNVNDILLALHKYHEVHKSFPARALLSKEGKPLLSWRVAVLPMLGESTLYSQFKLDEPWDSPHNKALVLKMPQVFASPNVPPEKRAEGLTTYLGLVAKKSLFGSEEGIAIRQIRDGTSNTIAIVDANGDHAVPWSKPDDLVVDLENPKVGLIRRPGEGFWAGLCDGFTLKIRDNCKDQTLRRLIQIDDGEVVDQDFRAN